MPISPFASVGGTSLVSTQVEAGLRPVVASAAALPAPAIGDEAHGAPAQTGDDAADGGLRSQLQEAADALGAYYQSQGTALTFHVDQDLQRLVVTVIDPSDGAVIRQIPGEDALRLARSLKTKDPRLVQQVA